MCTALVHEPGETDARRWGPVREGCLHKMFCGTMAKASSAAKQPSHAALHLLRQGDLRLCAFPVGLRHLCDAPVGCFSTRISESICVSAHLRSDAEQHRARPGDTAKLALVGGLVRGPDCLCVRDFSSCTSWMVASCTWSRSSALQRSYSSASTVFTVLCTRRRPLCLDSPHLL